MTIDNDINRIVVCSQKNGNGCRTRRISGGFCRIVKIPVSIGNAALCDIIKKMTIDIMTFLGKAIRRCRILKKFNRASLRTCIRLWWCRIMCRLDISVTFTSIFIHTKLGTLTYTWEPALEVAPLIAPISFLLWWLCYRCEACIKTTDTDAVRNMSL